MLTAFTAAIVLAAPALSHEGHEGPHIVARFGEETVTEEELDRFIQSLMPPTQPGQPAPSPTAAQREQLLERFIKVRVWTKLVEEAGIDVSDEEVDDALSEFKQERLGGNEQVYQQFLNQSGMTEEELREQIRKRLAPPKYIEQLSEDIEVTDEEVQQRYDELEESGNLEQLETVDVAHILVKSGEGEEKDAEKQIKDAHARITEDGESFSEVAGEVTEDPGSKDRGGKYENVGHGQFVPAFEERMWDMPIGEVSEPFESQHGWHILKVTERQDDFDSLRERVKAMIRRQRVEEKIDGMVEARLDDMEVEIMLDENMEEAAAGEAAAQ